MSILLLPLSWLYGLAAAVRNLAFDIGLFRRRGAGVPVIAVGNLTAGGTGKTPLVEYIAGRLGARGLLVAVVSRGYGRRSHGLVVVSCKGEVRADAFAGGDEPVQIARKFRSTSVVVAVDRIEAADTAVRLCGAQVILLDDAFQHRAIRRDLDILVIDAQSEFLAEHLLPAGRRREWFSGVRRADLIGFSRATGRDDPPWARALGRWSDARSFAFRMQITGFASIPGCEPVEPASLRGKRILAFSGIGNHASFVLSLRTAGVEVAAEKRFRDHHVYSARDVEGLLGASRDADACVTTEKDMVRLIADSALVNRLRGAVPFLYAMVGIELLRGEELLEQALDGAVMRRNAQ